MLHWLGDDPGKVRRTSQPNNSLTPAGINRDLIERYHHLRFTFSIINNVPIPQVPNL